jgi:hypothetical protein
MGKRKRDDAYAPASSSAGSMSTPITPDNSGKKKQKKLDPDTPQPEKRGASNRLCSLG